MPSNEERANIEDSLLDILLDDPPTRPATPKAARLGRSVGSVKFNLRSGNGCRTNMGISKSPPANACAMCVRCMRGRDDKAHHRDPVREESP
jgi:hypothetical protein